MPARARAVRLVRRLLRAAGAAVILVWLSTAIAFYADARPLVLPVRGVPASAVGDVVGERAVLGTVGNTGNARTTPAHLHFGTYALWLGGAPVDPVPLLRSADRAHVHRKRARVAAVRAEHDR